MIHLTDAAVEQILSLIEYEEDLGIRIEVITGGCSGFQYKFSKVNEATADINDRIIPLLTGEVLVFIDGESAAKLEGATIDYETSLISQGFVINIPNSECCGCGKSFT